MHPAPEPRRSAGGHLTHQGKYLYILPFAILRLASLALHQGLVGQSVSTSGVKHCSLAWSEEKLMNHPGSCWQGWSSHLFRGKWATKREHTHTHQHPHTLKYKLQSLCICSLVASQDMKFFMLKYDNTISYSHFSPLQATKHSGQGTFMSKIVSNQIVPWGWIAVIKPGNCYEPYEKDTEIMLLMLQIFAFLLFVSLQQLFKCYYSKYIEAWSNYKHREKSTQRKIIKAKHAKYPL